MKSTRKSTRRPLSPAITAVIPLALLVLLAASCTTAYIALPGPGKSAAPAKQGPKYPAMANNSTVRLEAAEYVGDLSIGANKVTLVGRGVGLTRIRGNVTIKGNSCVMKDLTVVGSVLISGNNADLRGARVEGKVRSTGNNNRW